MKGRNPSATEKRYHDLLATDWPTLTAERLTEMAEFESFKEVA